MPNERMPIIGEMPPEEFLSYSNEMLETLVAGAVERRISYKPSFASEVAEGGIGDYIEKERAFMREVLERFEEWSREENNVVLWDVDDTLGKVSYTPAWEWNFRPGMQLLIPYLTERYPNIQNGLLTTRDPSDAFRGFERYADLLEDYPLFSPKHVYSTETVVELPDLDHNAFIDDLEERFSVRASSATVKKFRTLQNLREEFPHRRYRIIDDDAIGSVERENGLCVKHLKPKF